MTTETYDLLALERWSRKVLTLLAVAVAIPFALVVSDVAYTLARSIWTGFASANVTNYGSIRTLLSTAAPGTFGRASAAASRASCR